MHLQAVKCHLQQRQDVPASHLPLGSVDSPGTETCLLSQNFPRGNTGMICKTLKETVAAFQVPSCVGPPGRVGNSAAPKSPDQASEVWIGFIHAPRFFSMASPALDADLLTDADAETEVLAGTVESNERLPPKRGCSAGNGGFAALLKA